MYSNNYHGMAPPYSQETAVGLVMAIGNIGPNLVWDMDRATGSNRATFLSRDGGINWYEVAKVPLIYEYGDHGGLIVAAPNT